MPESTPHLAHQIKRLRNAVGNALSAYPPEQPLAVACSAGCDSVVLAALAAEHRPVVLLHVLHGIRPEQEQDADLRIIDALCARIGARHRTLAILPGALEAAATRHGRSIEEEARRQRYRLLSEAARAEGCVAVLTAHHQDDDTETVLMRLLSGRGVWGSHGIPTRRAYGAVTFVRPFLDHTHSMPIGKQVLYAVAIGMALPFTEDSTNADLRYLRNAVRAQLVPVIERLFGAEVKGRIGTLGRNLSRIREQVGTSVQPLVRREGDGHVLNAAEFRALSALEREALLRRALFAVAASRSPDATRISVRSVRFLIDLPAEAPWPTNRVVEMEDVQVRVERDRLVVEPRVVRALQSGYLWRIDACVEMGLSDPVIIRSPALGDSVEEQDRRVPLSHRLNKPGVGNGNAAIVLEDRGGIAVVWDNPAAPPFWLRDDSSMEYQTTHDAVMDVLSEGEGSLGYAECE